MVRLAGFSMIAVSCSGLGVWYAWNMQQRLQHLHTMNRIIELLVSLLQYGLLPVGRPGGGALRAGFCPGV